MFSENTHNGDMNAHKIGQWNDLVAYYLCSDGNVWAYGTTNKWVNEGDLNTFKLRVANNQYRGKFSL